jgi:hypothetical protein
MLIPVRDVKSHTIMSKEDALQLELGYTFPLLMELVAFVSSFLPFRSRGRERGTNKRMKTGSDSLRHEK